jgi:hypothetical protein
MGEISCRNDERPIIAAAVEIGGGIAEAVLSIEALLEERELAEAIALLDAFVARTPARKARCIISLSPLLSIESGAPASIVGTCGGGRRTR